MRTFDDMMLALSTKIDFKTGESLFTLQQVELIEEQHKRKQHEFIKQQLLLQALMDVKRRLPPKVYDEIVMRISKNQDGLLTGADASDIEQLEKVGPLYS